MRNSKESRKNSVVDCNSVTVSATIEVKPEPVEEPVVGPMKINTLWGTLIRDHARMCIPDLECLVEYPLDYKFPAFAWSKKGGQIGQMTSSGFWPGDPKCLHQEVS